jgi:uncharacterized membrane protein YdjX (TVP38/TMEM64 family)
MDTLNLVKKLGVSQMNVIEWMINLAQVSLWMTVLVFFGIYILKPVVMFIPLQALYLAAGIIFQTWIAFIITFSGGVLALMSGYYSGKFLGEDRVHKYLTKNTKVERFLGGQEKKFLSLCFFYRLFPLPFDLFNMMCGIANVPFWKYLIISLLGLSVSIVPNILAGVYITIPYSPRFLLPFAIRLVIISGIFIWYSKKKGSFK